MGLKILAKQNALKAVTATLAVGLSFGCGQVKGSLTKGDSTSMADCSPNSVTLGQCKVGSAGMVVSNQFGSAITNWSNATHSTSLTSTIPNGFYANQTVNFTDADLVAANIVNGVEIFGVTGTASGTAACSSNGLQSVDCTATNGSYWTTTLRSSASGANGSLTVALPSGYYDGLGQATASDTNLIAGNVKSGVTIFGVAGSLVGAYAACTDDALNAGQCSTAASRYVTATAGANVTGAAGSLSATIPLGYYSGAQTCTMSDANLTAVNIKKGTTIFGVAGSMVSGYMTNMYRDVATTQVSIEDEATTNAGTDYTNSATGYRAVPQISKDDDGAGITGPNRTGWAATTCGLAGTIAARIADCAANGTIGANASWSGEVHGHAGEGNWKLVTRTGNVSAGMGREVWRDERTKLLWSSHVATSTNWCKASGSNFITGNPTAEDDPSNICDNATYQNTAGKAISACFEDNETNFTNTDTDLDMAGKAGLGYSSTPKVAWRLPTSYDFQQAVINGLRAVVPDGGSGINNWTSTVRSAVRTNAQAVDIYTGAVGLPTRANSYAVRCVGR